MRVWGRVYDPLDPFSWSWVQVDTDLNGQNDKVYLTALVQVLKLSLGESPFYNDYGIPGAQSVLTQIAPDYYSTLTQQRYAQHFASLIISRVDTPPTTLREPPVPTYDVQVVTHLGVILTANTAIPT